MTLSKHLATAIRQRCVNKGKMPSELPGVGGIFEYGSVRNPDLERLRQISVTLDCNVSDLFRDAEALLDRDSE